MNTKDLILRACALSVFKNVKEDKGVSALVNMIAADSESQLISAWADYFNALMFSQDTSRSYMLNVILQSENALSRALISGKYVNASLKNAAACEIETLAALASLETQYFLNNLQNGMCAEPQNNFSFLPRWEIGEQQIDYNTIINSYINYGYGVFAQSIAYKFDKSTASLLPIKNVSNVKLTDLKEYETEKSEILENTLNFIKELPANNVLLYGDRGTGKSSTVHAVLNELAPRGLRLVEVDKSSISYFPQILNILAQTKFKYIIFIDDLTFIDGADDYACLKAALEGSVGSKGGNALIYATTNRRHLLKETASDRVGEDMHVKDTREEQLSLSDRFGLVVTFINPDKREFIKILKQILSDRNITVPERSLELEAERYALSKGGRSPRAAKQLADIIQSRLSQN